MNQEEITLEFCVNKDKPELQCDGKCHLAKKLEQEPSFSVEVDKDHKKVPVPQEKLRIQEEILFVSEFSLEIPNYAFQDFRPIDQYQFLVSEAHLKEQEHPPSAII